MDQPNILHMLTPLKHISPFDVNMALDAGFDSVVPYTAVDLGEVKGLVQDAIFSRGPKGVTRTGVFLAGRDAALALDMLDAAKKAMVPPFEISVFADPAGSFTTAAALVACMERQLGKIGKPGLKDKRAVVFGATGIVGFAASVILGQEGARVTMAGYDGIKRVSAAAETAKSRFSVTLAAADASTETLKTTLMADVELAICAGRAGVQILSKSQLAAAPGLLVVADVNAVPPAGAEGVDAGDDGAPVDGSTAVGVGALAIGNIKYKTEQSLFRKMIEADKPVYLDFVDAFRTARELVAG